MCLVCMALYIIIVFRQLITTDLKALEVAHMKLTDEDW